MLALEFPPGLAGDEKSIELIEMLLAHTPQPFSREQFSPGHITATALAVDETGRIAMVFHARLQRWLLPGGHVEAEDSSIIAAAARELQEETGLQAAAGHIIGADVHGIPPKIKNGVCREPYHQHHDVLVAFRTTAQGLVLSKESEAVRWVAASEFDEFQVPANIRRAYARARRREAQ